MKKILVAIDAGKINRNYLDFACFLAKLTHSKIIGTFLSRKEEESKARTKLIDENIQFFKQTCENKGSNCSVHLDKGVPVSEIISESRFAELLIVDPEMSFGGKNEGIPTGFIKEVLTKSECPVVIAPFSFYGTEEILFAYDGSKSSLFAIKQFTYLFPELTDKKVTILQVNENEDGPVIEKEKIGELLQMHYSSIGFHTLYGKASDELYNYLLGKKNIFVVMGAFGRGMLSGFLKHSTAELVVKTINLPIFIAHN